MSTKIMIVIFFWIISIGMSCIYTSNMKDREWQLKLLIEKEKSIKAADEKDKKRLIIERNDKKEIIYLEERVYDSCADRFNQMNIIQKSLEI